MTPPPMTRRRLGTEASLSAAVESRTLGSSGRPGILVACEPAAMTACSNDIVCSPSGPGDVKLVRGPEGGGAVQHRDPPLPGERLEPARQSPHHPLGPAPQRFGLDPRCAEIDAVLLERPDLVDEPGDVQERLRRDAADVQAHAPEVGITLDEHGLLAEIGGAEGASVAPGPRPDHRDLGLLYRAQGALTGGCGGCPRAPLRGGA